MAFKQKYNVLKISLKEKKLQFKHFQTQGVIFVTGVTEHSTTSLSVNSFNSHSPLHGMALQVYLEFSVA